MGKAQTRASNKYAAKAYDRIALQVKKRGKGQNKSPRRKPQRKPERLHKPGDQ